MKDNIHTYKFYFNNFFFDGAFEYGDGGIVKLLRWMHTFVNYLSCYYEFDTTVFKWYDNGIILKLKFNFTIYLSKVFPLALMVPQPRRL
jgi:hypothetical protein